MAHWPGGEARLWETLEKPICNSGSNRLTYTYSYLEPVSCYMFSSTCCFLNCIQVSLEGGRGWPESQASRDQPRVCGGGTLVFLVAGRDSVFLITRRRTCPCPPALPVWACCLSLSLPAFPPPSLPHTGDRPVPPFPV